MNLFLLSAPYQILSALEAIHHFSFENNHLWIVETGHFTRAQFESVVDPQVWRSFRYVDVRYKLTHLDVHEQWPTSFREHLLEFYLLVDQFRKKIRTEKLARSLLQPVDNLILGNYRRGYDRHMRHFANRIRHGSLYLLDVGTDTLRVNMDRELDYQERLHPQSKRTARGIFGKMKLKIKESLIDWDTRGMESVIFFSAYDFLPNGRDHLVRNRFAYSKSLINCAKRTETVFFIGQPLVDQFYITLEDFEYFLAQVAQSFIGMQLVYVPHPRETRIQLDIVEKLRIEMRRFTVPFEHAIAFGGERPRCIASFFSSVVENSAAMFGEAVQIRVFRLPEDRLLKDRNEVALVYKQFEQNRRAPIDVVEVPSPASGNLERPRSGCVLEG